MGDAGTRQMQTDEPLHSFPCPLAATTLTPPTDHRQPVPSDPVNETTQAVTVARDGVIVQPGLHNTPQPAIRFADRQMPLTGFARMPKPSSASEHGSKRVEPKNSSTKQLTSRRNLPTDADKPRIRPTIACCPFGQLHARCAARWTCAGSGSVSGASRPARRSSWLSPFPRSAPLMLQQHLCSPTSLVLWTHLPTSLHREASSTRAFGVHVSLSV